MSSVAYQIVKDLAHLNRNFCSTDYDESLEYLNQLIPLTLYRYEKGFNGWEVPPKWDLLEGAIWFEGREIWRAEHPLQVIGLSAPFEGIVNREELLKHLHYDQRDPHATPYHFRQSYRPWDRTWGFCVTQDFWNSLQPGEYEVRLRTLESKGYLMVAEHRHAGSIPETFAFVAHLDHPGMANDDLAGVAVGVELFRRLAEMKTKFSYRLVLVQEIIGSVYYLQEQRADLVESCFIEMLGTKTELALQYSREGNSLLETALKESLHGHKHRTGPFRSIICNDEIVWESANIPMASLSRFPYPEYHSNKDNIDIISSEALEEAVQVLLSAIVRLDQSTLVRKKFEGVLAVSNPQYNLYVDPGQPAFGSFASESIQKLRYVMDLLPMAENPTFAEKLAQEADLPLGDVMTYLKQWEAKGLLTLT